LPSPQIGFRLQSDGTLELGEAFVDLSLPEQRPTERAMKARVIRLDGD
jgi:hypothetical protein